MIEVSSAGAALAPARKRGSRRGSAAGGGGASAEQTRAADRCSKNCTRAKARATRKSPRTCPTWSEREPLGDAIGRSSAGAAAGGRAASHRRRRPLPRRRPSDERSELRRRRDALAEQVTELHWDLGGLAYEMAIRDHFRLDVLVRRAAVLQERDAELAEVERLLRTGGERAARAAARTARRPTAAARCSAGSAARR